MLIRWSRAKTKGYEVGGNPIAGRGALSCQVLTWHLSSLFPQGVQIENMSESWANGLAFCALIHHFYPDSFDFSKLDPNNRKENLELAFQTIE